MFEVPARNESLFAHAARLASDHVLQITSTDEANVSEWVKLSLQSAEAFAHVMRNRAKTDLEHIVTDGMFDTIARLGNDIAKQTSHA